MPNPRPRYLLTPTQDASNAGRVILRDGSTAEVRTACPADQAALLDFFNHISPEARKQRFFTASAPSEQLIAAMCDDRDHADQRTLLVSRFHGGRQRIIAVGSFSRHGADRAEVAFAVDDDFKGIGLGTVLLERLALLAAVQGYRRFWAVTRFDNPGMRDVFRESGFEVHETASGGDIEVDFSVIPDEQAVARFEWRDRLATIALLRPFFQPRAVAVVGASRDPGSIGYRTLQAVVENGFPGAIYAINPKADTIAGLKAYPSVTDVPGPVDLAILTAVDREPIWMPSKTCCCELRD